MSLTISSALHTKAELDSTDSIDSTFYDAKCYCFSSMQHKRQENSLSITLIIELNISARALTCGTHSPNSVRPVSSPHGHLGNPKF